MGSASAGDAKRCTFERVTSALHFTGEPEADRLLAQDGFALLVGFALDQQVSVPRAFAAPLELKRRLGTLDPARIAATGPDELDRIFREKPALHRFPGAMAERVRELAAVVVEDYGGDAARLWLEASDAEELERRLHDLPGFGDMKVRSLLAVIAKLLDVRPAGIDERLPKHPTLGDVDSPEALARYQEAKRAYKASRKQASA
jgi:uncharacterized HhH-GPD family protein